MNDILGALNYTRSWFTLASKAVKLAKDIREEDMEDLKESYHNVDGLLQLLKTRASKIP
jgi:hypothetical protein